MHELLGRPPRAEAEKLDPQGINTVSMSADRLSNGRDTVLFAGPEKSR